MGIKCIIKNVKNTQALFKSWKVFRVWKSHHTKLRQKGFCLWCWHTYVPRISLKSYWSFTSVVFFFQAWQSSPSGIFLLLRSETILVKKKDKEGMLISTKSLTASISHLQQIRVLHWHIVLLTFLRWFLTFDNFWLLTSVEFLALVMQHQ